MNGAWERCNRFGLRFAPVKPADESFLSALYASTRREELAPLPWPEEEKAAFLQMQFEAQHRYYRQHYPAAQFALILQRGERIGRLYLDRRVDEYRLMDIALVPELRNQGLGTAILGDLLTEAQAVGKRVRIHVEHFNPAKRLYERLGFTQIEDRGVYAFMEWSPTS